jgi:hypothetical protein
MAVSAPDVRVEKCIRRKNRYDLIGRWRSCEISDLLLN